MPQYVRSVETELACRQPSFTERQNVKNLLHTHASFCFIGKHIANLRMGTSLCTHALYKYMTRGWGVKNANELVNLGAPKSSPLNKLHMFLCTDKIFYVEFQRVPLKCNTKYRIHTLKILLLYQVENLRALRFTSSYAFLIIKIVFIAGFQVWYITNGSHIEMNKW